MSTNYEAPHCATSSLILLLQTSLHRLEILCSDICSCSQCYFYWERKVTNDELWIILFWCVKLYVYWLRTWPQFVLMRLYQTSLMNEKWLNLLDESLQTCLRNVPEQSHYWLIKTMSASTWHESVNTLLIIVLSCVGRGLCDGLITRPEEPYRESDCVWLRNLNTEEDNARFGL
jgi:hypothetical protein